MLMNYDFPNPKEITKTDVKIYLQVEGPKVFWGIMYMIANIIVFATTWEHYAKAKSFDTLNHGVTVARSAAAVIKLNSALILLPVCRNLLSMLRYAFPRISDFIPLDKNITFHKLCARVMLVGVIAHTTAHYFNFKKLASVNIDTLNGIMVGTKFDSVPSFYEFGLGTLPGITGHLLTIIVMLLYTSAWDGVRRSSFEIFWYTHHTFFFYFLFQMLHGASALLEPPTFWLWTIGPLSVYLIERCVRYYRGTRDTRVVSVLMHPSDVMEVRMKATGFKYITGQYLFMNCPYVSPHEYHPFTITSCPHDEYLSVHIKRAGDWTSAFHDFLNPRKQPLLEINKAQGPDGSAMVRVDGAFGSASEEIFNFKYIILCGAGIGVTPFASILKELAYRLQHRDQYPDFALEKVIFYWICRDSVAFEWFQELLVNWEGEGDSILEVRNHLTKRHKDKEAIEILKAGNAQEMDQVTGLKKWKTFFGRPDWDYELEKLKEEYPTTWGIFFCGPKILSKTIYKAARAQTTVNGPKFVYHKENF
eukprot:GFYU01004442.1.p1 GENE.GFYU01004442.1~~GFYU01004442.1.p1  ORF type:complete len:532 (-),score=157.56 GFYU01004442.1:106-1701(-)